jgi:phosphoserine phosphatase RsbU/P
MATDAAVYLDEAPCGFLIFNDEGIITFYNHTIASMLEYGTEELKGRKFDSLLTIAGKIFYQTHFFPLISLHEKAEEIFLTLIGGDKREVPMLLNAKRKKVEDKYENHCVLIPVPNRKKYEDELILAKKTLEHTVNRNELLLQATTELEQHKVHLDKQVTKLSMMNNDLIQLSKVISHDMQEPIRKIAMFADIIHREDSLKLSEVSRTAIDRIKLGSKRMRDLISSLQQYVDVNTTMLKMGDCDLNDLVTRAKLHAIKETGFHFLELTVPALPKMEGQCEQLEILFYHLLVNSIQFRKHPTKAEVVIEADIIQQNSFRTIQGKYRYIDFVKIQFTDKGKGFDNSYNEYVFHLFKKAHTDAAGLGFGLALCKKIAENHYGSISASSAIGTGTTFTILLPLRQSSMGGE